MAVTRQECKRVSFGVQAVRGVLPSYRGLNNYQHYWGGSLLIISIVEWAPKPILIIKAPDIESYCRSLIEPSKDPCKELLRPLYYTLIATLIEPF